MRRHARQPTPSPSTSTQPALIYLPHDIQGAGATSPLAIGEPVMVRGVVTGRKPNGFFVQTEAGNGGRGPEHF